mmetsp:Transcript_28865/g.93039  ORF Transcript_28865/g.93039 Transcript_28865/m.93039 type:complete len:357 (+) Transcript_28865:27-1097(+)
MPSRRRDDFALSLLALLLRGSSPLTTTMEAQSSRLAARASRAARATRGDVRGGILWLEHLNIVIGDRALAEKFYFEEGLGLTRDPSKPGGDTPGTMWANLGWQQIHLAPESDDLPPRAARGAVGLVLPKASEAFDRLERLGVDPERHGSSAFTVTCPTSGNVFHCYDVDDYEPSTTLDDEKDDEDDQRKKAGAPPRSTTKMAEIHRKGDGRLDVRGGPGIRYVYVRCGDATTVAMNYAQLLGQRVDFDDGLATVDLGVGPVHLLLESTPDDDDVENGFHACVYVDNFAKRYRDLHEFVFTNPRFKHLDTCDTLDEALQSRTFRFKFPDAKNLEHETRAVSHFSFLKHIAYDGPPPP